jgi:hypothetical protein
MSVRHFGIVSQVYPPDPAAVGQHLADVAEELARRDHAVTVVTSDRAYDDPTERYARFERNGSIRIIRVPFSSFGKGSIAARLASGTSLLAQASVIIGLDSCITDLLLSTTPHLCGALGVGLHLLRGLPFHYWLMDLNPDQIVATGRLDPTSPMVRAFDQLNRVILARAHTITALDPAMAARFGAKGAAACGIAVQPPWASQAEARAIPNQENTFRREHGLHGKRVVMHAGNHSAVHPLDTLVGAIRANPELQLEYFFIGGGVGKRPIESWVQRERPARVTLLPYQPRELVGTILSAADVHVVTVGDPTVGIVHPSKLYGALAAARPVIVFGPAESPAARLVVDHDIGWHVEHGDVTRATVVLQEIAGMPESTLNEYQARALELSRAKLSRDVGVKAFCDRILA